MREYWFYLSCAQANWEPYLESFYHDLSKFLSRRVGISESSIGYFGVNEIEVDADWNKSTVSALNNSRVFIPLFTQAYFLSEDCGKEWEIFRSRQRARESTVPAGVSLTSLIMPVLWLPECDLPKPPPAIASEVHYTLGDYRQSYAQNGLRQLIALSEYRDEYRDFLSRFTDKLYETASAYKLPPLEKIPPIAKITSAFEEPRPQEPVITKFPTDEVNLSERTDRGRLQRPLLSLIRERFGVEQSKEKKKQTGRSISLSKADREADSRIFISYRRNDSEGFAGRLFDQLSSHFGEAQIFMDIDTIEPGEDFVQVIEEAVSSCNVMIAVIGKAWLTSADAQGRRRLDNPEDFVRVEISAALKRNIRVIPVLVQGAEIPQSNQLPDELVKLARRNAFELSSTRWKYDVGRLVVIIEKVLGKSKSSTIA